MLTLDRLFGILKAATVEHSKNFSAKIKFITKDKYHSIVRCEGCADSSMTYQQKGVWETAIPSEQKQSVYKEESGKKTYTKGSKDEGNMRERSRNSDSVLGNHCYWVSKKKSPDPVLSEVHKLHLKATLIHFQ